MTINFDQYAFVALLFFLALEQIICLFYIQYLGHFGIKIYSRMENIPIEKIAAWCAEKNKRENLASYKKNDTFYFKFRNPRFSLWPCICAARVKGLARIFHKKSGGFPLFLLDFRCLN